MAKVLELQLQYQSFQWIFSVHFLDWFHLLAVQGTQKSSLAPQYKSINSSVLSLLYGSTLTSGHDYWKNHALTIQTFVGKVMSMLFNTLSRFVLAFLFLKRSKCLLILRLQSLSKVILAPKKIKTGTVSTFSPSICHEVMGLEAMIFVFWMLSFKPTFSLFSFTFSRGSLVLHFLP